jgi:MFS family permease
VNRLGPLRHREFRLLFLGRLTSMFGNALAPVALAFAVLELTGSKSDLGFVLAARQIPQIVFLLIGGVWADRLPRHRVMVLTSYVSGTSQLVLAALLLAGEARLWHLLILAVVNGSSTAFFFPASAGIVPQTVPEELQQQANALLRLGVNATVITGAALGGLIVAAASPGWAILVDGCTFFAAAYFIGLMRLPAALRIAGSTALRELADGWREFRSRTWLWAIVAQFSIVNAAAYGAENVLGPVIARDHLGGAAAFGFVLTAQSLGLLAGGFILLHWRPRRLLLIATLAIFFSAAPLVGFAFVLAVPAIMALAFLGGVGVEIFGVFWDTTMQQEIPAEKLSRVYSYDALGSWVFMPIGLAVAGPVADAIGTKEALLGACLLIWGASALVLLSRDVRTLARRTYSPARIADSKAAV